MPEQSVGLTACSSVGYVPLESGVVHARNISAKLSFLTPSP